MTGEPGYVPGMRTPPTVCITRPVHDIFEAASKAAKSGTKPNHATTNHRCGATRGVAIAFDVFWCSGSRKVGLHTRRIAK